MDRPIELCIIDDDKIFLFGIRRLAETSNQTIHLREFHNGQSALDFFKRTKEENDELPDVILLDLNMPVLDGWQFLEEFSILCSERQACVIVLSSSIDPNDLERAKHFPIVKKFVHKPISRATFESFIQE
jgi:CheY-like chemotaxis protein